MQINYLSSGGIIANYQCPASCGHCLYGCSPKSEPGYITEATAEKICETLRRFGCYSVHIGGGEPFLNVDGLIALIRTLKQNGVEIQYIETNAAWITGDENKDKSTIFKVLEAGANCIMVSTDPFHVGFIPFWKPVALIRLLEKMNASHFIWQQHYLSLLNRLDSHKLYNSEELKEALGYDVISKCVLEYGMCFNGRALNLLRKIGVKKPINEFLSLGPCRELHCTEHFHIDFNGRYIPPGCTGMGVLTEDLGNKLNLEKYPILSRLLDGGINSLLEYTLSHGYTPSLNGYVSKCELCFSIRKHFMQSDTVLYQDLTPISFYQQGF